MSDGPGATPAPRPPAAWRAARRFGGFWYDFVVGDDWRLAIGAVVAIGATWVMSRHTPGWWVMLTIVPVVLAVSLRRAYVDTKNEGEARRAR